MVKIATRIFCAVLCTLLFSLSGCGATPDHEKIHSQFNAQTSISSHLVYTIHYEAVIGDKTYNQYAQRFEGQIDVDCATGDAFVDGVIATLNQDIELSATELEVYQLGAENRAYCRYGEQYFIQSGEFPYLSIVYAPSVLNLDEYTRKDGSQLVHNRPCIVYDGFEVAGDSLQQFIFTSKQDGISLNGSLIDVSLAVDEDSFLPAEVMMDFQAVEEMGLTMVDGAGNQYTVTGLTYEVTYSAYGLDLDLAPSEKFKTLALQGGELTQLPADDGSGITSVEDIVGAAVSDFTGSTVGNFINSYPIYNETQDCFYLIDTPEYTSFKNSSRDSVSFVYYFDDNDFEVITYRLHSNCTPEELAVYAAALPGIYRNENGVEDVAGSDVTKYSTDHYEIQFATLGYKLKDSGETYSTLEVISWIPAPNGQDCLEVTVSHFNGTGDGVMIDTIQELESAYQSILGNGKLN